MRDEGGVWIPSRDSPLPPFLGAILEHQGGAFLCLPSPSGALVFVVPSSTRLSPTASFEATSFHLGGARHVARTDSTRATVSTRRR